MWSLTFPSSHPAATNFKLLSQHTAGELVTICAPSLLSCTVLLVTTVVSETLGKNGVNLRRRHPSGNNII